MTHSCQLSHNTKNYLEQYECILKEMIEKMSCVKATDSISGNFIAQMIPHHQAAIAMSENLLKYTTNIELQEIARHIISSQQKSIENMTAVYECCTDCSNSSENIRCYEIENERIQGKMFHDMGTACADNGINGNFMREMIPHHRGAVCMSENALLYPLCPELVPQLKEIIVSQKEGIRQMQCLLRRIGCC